MSCAAERSIQQSRAYVRYKIVVLTKPGAGLEALNHALANIDVEQPGVTNVNWAGSSQRLTLVAQINSRQQLNSFISQLQGLGVIILNVTANSCAE
jgi:hypothetical protein